MVLFDSCSSKPPSTYIEEALPYLLACLPSCLFTRVCLFPRRRALLTGNVTEVIIIIINYQEQLLFSHSFI